MAARRRSALPFQLVRRLLPAVSLLCGACALAPPPGIGAPVAWRELPGWTEERPAEAWGALRANCERLPARDAGWRTICEDAALFPEPDDDTARAFFESRFEPHVVHGDDARRHNGVITGYYEPLLNGSRRRTGRFRYPVYGQPEDLLVVDLGGLYPELKGRTLRGRLDGRRVVPYASRAEIGGAKRLRAPVLAWVDDAVALFFLQIQGSGRIRLEDGATLYVGYADQNGHPYVAIGNTLVQRGALKPEEVNLQGIRDWLAAHPYEAEEVLNGNPSYVFFAARDRPAIGALGVPLTPERSLALDPAYLPLGAPVWLDTSLPDAAPFRRLMFAQDTGGAIKGPARADVFFGFGSEAERRAGAMKSRGRLFVLLPAKRPIE